MSNQQPTEECSEFFSQTISDAFHAMDRFVYENSPGLKEQEKELRSWITTDDFPDYVLEQSALEWFTTFYRLSNEIKLFYCNFARFLCLNHRPAEDLDRITKEVLLRQPNIKQLFEQLEEISCSIDVNPRFDAALFRKYQETNLKVDILYAQAAAKVAYAYYQTNTEKYQQMDDIFTQLIG